MSQEDGNVMETLNALLLELSEDALFDFACDCAFRFFSQGESAGRTIDAKYWAAIETKRQWLSGKLELCHLDALHPGLRTISDIPGTVASGVLSLDAQKSARTVANAVALHALTLHGSDAWEAERKWQIVHLLRLRDTFNGWRAL